jgi:hypothetical protein
MENKSSNGAKVSWFHQKQLNDDPGHLVRTQTENVEQQTPCMEISPFIADEVDENEKQDRKRHHGD